MRDEVERRAAELRADREAEQAARNAAAAAFEKETKAIRLELIEQAVLIDEQFELLSAKYLCVHTTIDGENDTYDTHKELGRNPCDLVSASLSTWYRDGEEDTCTELGTIRPSNTPPDSFDGKTVYHVFPSSNHFDAWESMPGRSIALSSDELISFVTAFVVEAMARLESEGYQVLNDAPPETDECE